MTATFTPHPTPDTGPGPDRAELPPPPPRPPEDQPSRTPGGRRGLLPGLVIGALVGGIAAGGTAALLTRGDDTPPPATSDATAAPTGEVATPHNAIAELVATARPSIVAIHDSVTQTDIFGQAQVGQAAGTGFVLSSDGFVVTNDHVIDGATDITVDFDDGTSEPATVVAADPNADLAVLQVDRTDLVPLPLGSSGDLQVGDQLVAIGNALDLSGEPTVTTGIVSATGRSLTEPNGVHLVDLIQTDTAINPGNSGGPLLDMSGHVVGINTAISAQGQNIGFAIAIDPAKAMIEQLRNGEIPEHALMGVSTRPAADGTGVEVVQVEPDSGADRAGLRIGDVITDVDGVAIDSPDALGTVVNSHRPGDQLTVTYLRGGRTDTAEVTLGARPTDG